jgi:hypothetical protein
MNKSIARLVALGFATSTLLGCATNPSGNSILGIPTYENACRNYHKFISSKDQRYKCVEVYSGGDKYDGELVNDFIRDGYGVYYYSNGTRYEGQWRNDKKNGQGTQYHPDGSVAFSGLFENNVNVPESEIQNRKIIAENLRQKNEIRIKEEMAKREAQQKLEAEDKVRRQRESDRIAREEQERIKRDGDGSPDDLLCKKYGFKLQTSGYAQCRMQIELAKSQAQEQQRQYQAQVAEQEKARERAKGEALLMLGLGMMAGGGQRPSSSNFTTIQPPQMDRIYNLPGGKFMRCSTLGMVTNCQ